MNKEYIKVICDNCNCYKQCVSLYKLEYAYVSNGWTGIIMCLNCLKNALKEFEDRENKND